MSTFQRIRTEWERHNLGPWHGSVTITVTQVNRGRQSTRPSDWMITVNASWQGPPAGRFEATQTPVAAADCVTAPDMLTALQIARRAADDLEEGRRPQLRHARR